MRSPTWPVWAGLLTSAACAPTEQAPDPTTPAKQQAAPMDHDQPPSKPRAEAVEAMARTCDGTRIRALGPDGLANLQPEAEHPSAAVLAWWEGARSFDADGDLTQGLAAELAKQLRDTLGHAPPQWWVEHLQSAHRYEGREPPAYDGQLADRGDRRGPWVEGPAKRWIRPGVEAVLGGDDASLTYDFSMGRAKLGEVPSESGTMVELTRAHAGSVVYFAAFNPGSGGFPFTVRAVDSDSTLRWSAEACGPKRQVLGGLGHLIVELRVLEATPPAGGNKVRMPEPDGLAVFSAESHGVALEVFDLDTGARTFAWSSDLWFARE